MKHAIREEWENMGDSPHFGRTRPGKCMCEECLREESSYRDSIRKLERDLRAATQASDDWNIKHSQKRIQQLKEREERIRERRIWTYHLECLQ